MQYNSLFTYHYINANSDDWQSHLERISDFLIFGEDIWWEKTDFGIEFFDVTKAPDNFNCVPKMHHFRSSDNDTVQNDLKRHWLSILNYNISIPTNKIYTHKENEIPSCRSTKFLADYINVEDPDIQVSLSIAKELPDDISEDVDINSFTLIQNENHYFSDLYEINMESDITSKEGKSIYFVLENHLPLIKKYADLKESNSNQDCVRKELELLENDLLSQVSSKLGILKQEMEKKERSFFVNHDMSPPTMQDIQGDESMCDIYQKIVVSQRLLSKHNRAK